MNIDMTENEFRVFVDRTPKYGIIDFLLKEGLTLKEEPLPELKMGFYRRENGMDLIHWDGYQWRRIDYSGVYTKITWALGEDDCWVQVLDNSHYPIVNGSRVKFDAYGTRVA